MTLSYILTNPPEDLTHKQKKCSSLCLAWLLRSSIILRRGPASTATLVGSSTLTPRIFREFSEKYLRRSGLVRVGVSVRASYRACLGSSLVFCLVVFTTWPRFDKYGW